MDLQSNKHIQIMSGINKNATINTLVAKYGFFEVGETLTELLEQKLICESRDRYVLSKKGRNFLKEQCDKDEKIKAEEKFLKRKRKESKSLVDIYLP